MFTRSSCESKLLCELSYAKREGNINSIRVQLLCELVEGIAKAKQTFEYFRVGRRGSLALRPSFTRGPYTLGDRVACLEVHSFGDELHHKNLVYSTAYSNQCGVTLQVLQRGKLATQLSGNEYAGEKYTIPYAHTSDRSRSRSSRSYKVPLRDRADLISRGRLKSKRGNTRVSMIRLNMCYSFSLATTDVCFVYLVQGSTMCVR